MGDERVGRAQGPRVSVRGRVALRAFVASGVAVASLGGCTGDAGPVPTTAAEPFVCAGVPARGLEIMAGVSSVVAASGPWEWDTYFHCALDDQGGRPVAIVSHEDATLGGSGPVEDQIAAIRAGELGTPIEADAAGAGYVRDEDGSGFARWVCPDGLRTDVRLWRVDGSRDVEEDLARYMTSMLPWACGDEDAPPRTAD